MSNLLNPGKNWKPINLAGDKPAIQSTTAHGGEAGRAVDGNRNSHYLAKSCTHTNVMTSPWWRVDLQNVVRMKKLKLANLTQHSSFIPPSS